MNAPATVNAPVSATVSDLLRMHSTAARVLAGVYALTCVLMAVYSAPGAETAWPLGVAVLVCVASGFALVGIEGDPIPIVPALAMMLTGAVSSACVFTVVPASPAPHPTQLWTYGLSTTIFVFMCVRGRTLLAWIGLLLMIATAAVWAHATGPGAAYGVGVSVINAGPVLMGTAFAYTIRPLARSIYVLRARSTRRIAAESAAAAVLEERDAQLDRLDALARPMLERIASGKSLSEADRVSCGLLEARLRDTLRAPVLQDERVAGAAEAARRRGVEVVMLDDHGMDDVAPPVRERVLAAVAEHLGAAQGGAVTVRVLPPGRSRMVSMLVRGSEVRRIELDHAGKPSSN